ncbi:hypothetical protein LPJ72_005092 [Coemansia sp. Benny D160-2]|nr:hypothetical protein LPJ72_005092 [Coemansia sp. Benny D160-2]
MMLNTVTALCALAASSVVLATNEAPQISIPGPVNNAQPVPPPVVAANGSPAEVGYAPQVLVASQQYAADKSNQIQQQQGQARAGENSVDASSEELLLSDIFGSISNMVDEHSSKHSSDDGLSSGAGHQFSSVFGYNAVAAGAATIATSIGVALAFF